MDQFTKNLILIKKDIDTVKEDYIIDSEIKHKQLLVYYLYRFFCKFNTVISVNTSKSYIKDIFTLLGIPEEMLNKCFPLCGKMSNKVEELNKILKKSIELLELFTTNFTTLDKKGKPEDITKITDFMISKNNKKQIQEDLILLSLLLPKLSKIMHKPYLKE